ncbi:MAG: response regulator transcription factor [Dongiaceae bacterium]
MTSDDIARRVTIVDGDEPRRRELAARLEESGYRVAVCADAGLLRGDGAPPADMVVLDLDAPGGDGLALVRELRACGGAPLILVTGRGSVAERVAGLGLGADDYIARPFDPRELVARIDAVLRRRELVVSGARRPVLQRWAFAGWQLDAFTRRLAAPDGAPVDLTASEYRLLEILVSSPGQLQRREDLLKAIYQRDWTRQDRSIDNLVVRLRRKLRDDSRSAQLIRTARGGGYLLTAPVRVIRDGVEAAQRS